MLGCGEGEEKEIRILNNVVRIGPDGIELEADPRHAELVIRELGLEGAKESAVPGSKESNSRNGGMKRTEVDKRRRELSKEEYVDNIQDAKDSAGDIQWSELGGANVGMSEQVDDPELDRTMPGRIGGSQFG